MPLAAYMLGARIIEKHFTLNRAMKGTDHRFSLEPQGLQKMVRDLHRVRSWRLATGRRRCTRARSSPVAEDGEEARGDDATCPPATC